MIERKSGLAHCCHHDRHWEFCYDFDERVDYIIRNKPKDEQALRLRLFQLVPDDLLPGRISSEWAAYVKAWDARNKAWAAYHKTGVDYYEAWDAYYKAWDAYFAKYQPQLDILHDKLFPDCTWNGTTIFGKEEVV